MNNQRTLQGTNVSYLPEKDGKVLDLVIIQTPNRPSIVRRGKQFLADLRESGLINHLVKDMAHPVVTRIIADFKQAPFTIVGNIKDCKKGEKWKVTESSSCITNPNHHLYNQVQVGDELPYEADMTIVEEGFLRLAPNPMVTQQNKIAESVALAMSSMFSTYNQVSTVEESTTAGANNGQDIDPDVMAQVAQHGASDKAEEEVAEDIATAIATATTQEEGTK